LYGRNGEKLKNALVLIPATLQFQERLESTLKGFKILYFSGDGDNKNLDSSLLQETEIIIGFPDKGLLPKCPNLRWLQLSSAGAEGFAPFIRGDVVLTNATGAYGNAVSTYMLAYVLTFFLRLHEYRDQQMNCVWKRRGNVRTTKGSVVLCVGMGNIGSIFTLRMKDLGAYVIGVRKHAAISPEPADELITLRELDNYLPKADIVAISLPCTPETVGLMNRERIGKMKHDGVLINVARGSLVDTQALCDALEYGSIGGAILDVTDPEPLPPDHKLWRMENAIVTPQVSGSYRMPGTLELVYEICLENALRYVNGQALKNMIDPLTGYRLN
jgi:phosphoglycerate dehydrogenase-like enzyme